jgi:hypothetical protein
MTDAPQQDEKAKREDTNKRLRGIIVTVLLVTFASCIMLSLCVGGIVYVSVRLTQPAADQGSAFLQAIASENDEAAYALLTPDVQAEFDSPAGLGQSLRERGIRPDRWTWSRNVENNSAQLDANVIMADGSQRQTTITLTWDGEQWRINGFSFGSAI